MDGDEKRFVRSIVRRVHPDLFGAHPYERNRNAESLKVLNVYVDALANGRPVDGASSLEFWVKDDDAQLLTRIESQLPAYGSLGPLFFAFGLITREELEQGLGTYDHGADSRNFLEWLQATVSEALATAEQHEALKSRIRQLRAGLEDGFQLAAVHVGGEFAVGFAEQARQLEALEVAQAAMQAMVAEEGGQQGPNQGQEGGGDKDGDKEATGGGKFEGLSLRLYHPDSAPFDATRFAEADLPGGRAPVMQSYVADDGVLHLVADKESVREALMSLDLEQARLLTRLSMFWTRRVRELTPAVAELLGIENVWCDTRTEQSAQRFVLWAGYMLGSASSMREQLQGRRFSFSLLVHCDTTSPLVDFLSSSSVLQVRSDCPPARLLEFLLSESGEAAHESAEAVATTREAEEAALDSVRVALGAKHVIRVCSSYDQDKVLAACQRLLENAEVIRTSVDLSGTSIAIDDCYELWESGFMSIPYDFQVADLQPQLQRLLAASGSAAAAAAAAAATGGGSEQGSSDAAGNGELLLAETAAAAAAAALQEIGLEASAVDGARHKVEGQGLDSSAGRNGNGNGSGAANGAAQPQPNAASASTAAEKAAASALYGLEASLLVNQQAYVSSSGVINSQPVPDHSHRSSSPAVSQQQYGAGYRRSGAKGEGGGGGPGNTMSTLRRPSHSPRHNRRPNRGALAAAGRAAAQRRQQGAVPTRMAARAVASTRVGLALL